VNTHQSPAAAYEIGQYFKENELANSIDGANRAEEGSPQHLLAQTLLATLTANLAGNDALSAALAAGGSEALAPALGRLLYGTQDTNEPELSELDATQKETISAILSLGSLSTTLATGGSTTDAVASGAASSVAVEDNALALLLEPAAPLILGGLITTGVLSQVDADALQAEVDRQLYTLGELTDEAATEIAQAFGVTVNVIKEVANQSNDETNNQESSQGGTTASGGVPEPDDEGDWIQNPTKSESQVWKDLQNYKNGTKTSGSGSNKRYYQWDHTHNDIEVYDRRGKHLGSMSPTTGEIYKLPVKGREIKI